MGAKPRSARATNSWGYPLTGKRAVSKTAPVGSSPTAPAIFFVTPDVNASRVQPPVKRKSFGACQGQHLDPAPFWRVTWSGDQHGLLNRWPAKAGEGRDLSSPPWLDSQDGKAIACKAINAPVRFRLEPPIFWRVNQQGCWHRLEIGWVANATEDRDLRSPPVWKIRSPRPAPLP